MSQNNWEADKMLDVYIFDYFMKRKLHATAKTFQAEGKVSTDPVAIDAPGGFLFEWWSVFWDIFIARTNEKHSEPAASYLETQLAKAKELQQQQNMQHPKPQQHQQMQTQQLLLQRHAQQQQQQQQQQQRRDVIQHPTIVANGPTTSDNSRHSSPTASALAARMYEGKLKLPFQRDSLGDAVVKQELNDNTGQLVDPNNASMLKAAALAGQPGQTLNGAGGSGSVLPAQNHNQQISVSTQDMKNEVNPIMYPGPRVSRMEGPITGSHGSNQIGNNLPLKGWPLSAVEQLGFLQQQRLLQPTQQPLNKIQLQQQLILQAQRNLASPSTNDLDQRKLQMLLVNQNIGARNSGNMLGNIGSPTHAGPALPQRETDSITKQQLQNMNPLQQHYSQQPLSRQQSQNSNQEVRQQEKMIGSGSTAVEGAISLGNDQTSKGQVGRKRKQPGSFSGPANSSGTANTTGPSPSSPSTPSTHTAGDAMSLPALSNDGGSSKSMLMFGSDGMGSLASAPNELADMDRMVDDRTLDDNVESFFSHDALDPKDTVGQPKDISKGFTFSEIRAISASTSKVECCHFSLNGKLLATGGHDKKVTLWCTESYTVKSVLEEHTQWITDVRFGPHTSRLATSSADKTVRVWDVDNPVYSIRTFMGHATTVTSVDFHPSKEDLICSCDDNGEMRCWSIKNGSCTGVFKGGATLTRFQPRFGRIIAAAAGNSVSLLDVDTLVCRLKLQGHENSIHSVSWDPSGESVASVSDDLIRVWAVRSSSKGECIHELSCTGNKFYTCVFHPMYPSLLIIGCYETIELWNMTENKTMTLQAHEKLVSSLAVSSLTGLVASASHDKCVKLWK